MDSSIKLRQGKGVLSREPESNPGKGQSKDGGVDCAGYISDSDLLPDYVVSAACLCMTLWRILRDISWWMMGKLMIMLEASSREISTKTKGKREDRQDTLTSRLTGPLLIQTKHRNMVVGGYLYSNRDGA